jgi:hypothetical protein
MSPLKGAETRNPYRIKESKKEESEEYSVPDVHAISITMPVVAREPRLYAVKNSNAAACSS